MSILKWFYKAIKEESPALKAHANDGKFTLKIEGLDIGYLKVEDGQWLFWYSEDFKNQTKYSRLVGFSDLTKTYKNEVLWPFFKIRIPGLKQPLVREILEQEHIDKDDEVSLLKRFGRRNISNPYILEPM